ncbi:exosome complex exonuclease [Cyclospora cayetanensis]|uniref:Exosome complex exonuclease n=1 Tax=Cyclospora cayetanensis TaxID=88456 RepID=A0A1D3CSU8_9EIME|nr:exosome complex exonuclease [Cyclospora cayetanensis]
MQVNRLVYVRPLRSRYEANVGDVVVGRVAEISNGKWLLDVGAARLAYLSLGAVSLDVQRRRDDADLLEMNYGGGTGWASSDMHANRLRMWYCSKPSRKQVQSDGLILLHTRNARYGKLSRGLGLQVSPQLVKRQSKHVAVLRCGLQIILGVNGNTALLPSSPLRGSAGLPGSCSSSSRCGKESSMRATGSFDLEKEQQAGAPQSISTKPPTQQPPAQKWSHLPRLLLRQILLRERIEATRTSGELLRLLKHQERHMNAVSQNVAAAPYAAVTRDARSVGRVCTRHPREELSRGVNSARGLEAWGFLWVRRSLIERRLLLAEEKGSKQEQCLQQHTQEDALLPLQRLRCSGLAAETAEAMGARSLSTAALALSNMNHSGSRSLAARKSAFMAAAASQVIRKAHTFDSQALTLLLHSLSMEYHQLQQRRPRQQLTQMHAALDALSNALQKQHHQLQPEGLCISCLAAARTKWKDSWRLLAVMETQLLKLKSFRCFSVQQLIVLLADAGALGPLDVAMTVEAAASSGVCALEFLQRVAETAASLAAAGRLSTKELLWISSGFARLGFAAARPFYAAAAKGILDRDIAVATRRSVRMGGLAIRPFKASGQGVEFQLFCVPCCRWEGASSLASAASFLVAASRLSSCHDTASRQLLELAAAALVVALVRYPLIHITTTTVDAGALLSDVNAPTLLHHLAALLEIQQHPQWLSLAASAAGRLHRQLLQQKQQHQRPESGRSAPLTGDRLDAEDFLESLRLRYVRVSNVMGTPPFYALLTRNFRSLREELPTVADPMRKGKGPSALSADRWPL